MIIMKLKERIKSLNGNLKEEKIKRVLEEIKTINIELDHRVTKLVAENEHFKQTYKQLYDSIKSSRVRSKEQCDALIKQVNINSIENSDLNASLQEKVLVITALKDSLSKLKGKAVVNEAVPLHPIDPELLKIDVAPLASKLQNNKTAHYDYLKHTQKETATLREIVENERFLNPLNTSLDYACFPNCSLVFGLWMLQAYNRRPLLAHQLRTEISGWCRFGNWISRKQSLYFVSKRYDGVLIYLSFVQGFKDQVLALASPFITSELWYNNHLARQGLVRGLPKLKFKKDHICSACAMGKRKLQPKADIGIFIGYAPTKKAFQIYNRRTRRIVETIHVDFDELTAMASEQSSSGPTLNEMTPATISSGLVLKPSSSRPYVPPSRNDWDLLFQPLFDELLTPSPSVDP
uniref:Retroviral polymerase SH3-like domain-containing protein n=1 Tax=Tanacetum cinerariifolium TaxID=118510 RepID=A0A699HL64_TANCI|nr:hypothetical protein [Tanacetum cinerariifolium]